jgi:tRNA threonylcarbamoyladenosine biosynthesis protein TsaB
MTVLGIDTATSRGSVALARPGEVLATAVLLERGAHARDLMVEIDRLMARAGLLPGDLRGIAVTLGPGSFTGVRVALSTAKGLAYGLDIALTGVSTLEALARAAVPEGEAPALCAAIAAGRGEVYAALFGVEAGKPIRRSEDRSYHPAELVRLLPPETRVVGDATTMLERAAREAGIELRVIESWPLLAGPLALWGCRTLPPGTHYQLGGLRPNYVRPADAAAPRR